MAATSTTTRKTAVLLAANVPVRSEHRLFGLDGPTQASAAGRLSFKDAPAAVLDAAGANTQGDDAKLNLSAIRATLLPAQWWLTTSTKLHTCWAAKTWTAANAWASPAPVPAPPAATWATWAWALAADVSGGVLKLQVARGVTGGNPTRQPVSRTRWLLQGGWVF